MVGQRWIASCVLTMMVCCWMSNAAADTIKVETSTTLAAPDLAVPGTWVGAPEATSATPEAVRQAELWQRLQPFIPVTDQGFVVDSNKAQASGIDLAFLSEAEATYKILNHRFTEQQFDWLRFRDEIHTNRDFRIDGQGITPNATASCTLIACRVTLSEWETGALIRTLAVGAGAGGVYALMAAMGVATLPAGALVGLVSTLVGLGATVIDLIDYIGHNQGVYFYVRLVPLAVLVWHN